MANISWNIPDNNLKKTLFAILKLFVQSNNYAIHHIGNPVKTSRIIKKLKKKWLLLLFFDSWKEDIWILNIYVENIKRYQLNLGSSFLIRESNHVPQKTLQT